MLESGRKSKVVTGGGEGGLTHLVDVDVGDLMHVYSGGRQLIVIDCSTEAWWFDSTLSLGALTFH